MGLFQASVCYLARSYVNRKPTDTYILQSKQAHIEVHSFIRYGKLHIYSSHQTTRSNFLPCCTSCTEPRDLTYTLCLCPATISSDDIWPLVNSSRLYSWTPQIHSFLLPLPLHWLPALITQDWTVITSYQILLTSSIFVYYTGVVLCFSCHNTDWSKQHVTTSPKSDVFTLPLQDSSVAHEQKATEWMLSKGKVATTLI